MKSFFRTNEYLVLFYRIGIAYLFYFIARVLFYFYNSDIVEVDSFFEFFRLSYHGLAFDTTAILYVNSLFILVSILPFFINTKSTYQKVLSYIYFIPNLIFYSLNFVDFIYYKYNFSRLTLAAWDVFKHEKSQVGMFFRFLITYWDVFLIFILVSIIWIIVYRLVKVKVSIGEPHKGKYMLSSIIGVLVIGALCIGGIRGDFKKSTLPINLVDANRHVVKTQHADIVLNSTFTFLRTLKVKSFIKTNFNIPEKEVVKILKPIKFYNNYPQTKPNIVLIITESMGREYVGAFNKNSKIKNYKSYTPFIDSLAQHSLIYSNAYGNGYKSIHGMSSILSGIPSFKEAFTSSPYAKQKIESLVSCLKSKGYDTSFFHGAPNGSMGFLGFGNILGFDHYYGMTEYGKDSDFDGSWGIWDEPFMQFMNQTISKKKAPFFSTIFTVTSHEPYVVPKKYEGKFPKGTVPMHQVIGYTDYAFKKFFESAKKQPWYKNTLFIITADHANLVAYPDEFFNKVMNRMAVPILFYKPDGSLKGENTEYAQHIDIFPTILDIIGYDKPFRSWGRSLINKSNDITPFVMQFNTGNYIFARGNYICVINEKNELSGFYAKSDKEMLNNLISKRNKEMNDLEIACKAFIQDYFNRIIDKKLSN